MDLGKIMEVFRERFKEVEKELSKPEVASGIREETCRAL